MIPQTADAEIEVAMEVMPDRLRPVVCLVQTGCGQSSQEEPERLLRSFALRAEAHGDRLVRVETALVRVPQSFTVDHIVP